MELNWQLADAKNRLSEVVRMALSDGPQRITRRNDVVFLISEEEYTKLTGAKPSFIDYLVSGPSFDGVQLDRQKDSMRDVGL